MTKNIGTDARIERLRLQSQTAHPATPDVGYSYLYNTTGSYGGLFMRTEQGIIGPFITGSYAIDPQEQYSTASPNADDDEFSDGVISSDWKQIRGDGTGTIVWSEGRHCMNAAFQSNVGNAAQTILKAATLADGEAFEIGIAGYAGVHQNYPMMGLCITNGTGTASAFWSTNFYTASNVPVLLNIRSGTIASSADVVAGGGFNFAMHGHSLFRIRLHRIDSTHFAMKVSINGVQWTDYGSSAGYNPSMIPTHAGLWVSTWSGASKQLASFEYFRKVTV